MRKSVGEKERELERGIGGAQGERLHGGGAIKVFVDGRGEEKLNICTAPLCVSLC